MNSACAMPAECNCDSANDVDDDDVDDDDDDDDGDQFRSCHCAKTPYKKS
ncbi:Uncharacterized protein BM_BM17653 [Brugia malayi]|uniref:Uncharacterized protein n=1 Tax=Brugia malayi TaxID=6279 RepID=A0A4E9FJY5_BRUMA|nr:Uncharacterized protein BM_BM17653 [Brugia malayi]VIO96822.1 Uncharacterized protein BM_BM17653 [Brugia malayi]